MNGGTYPTSPTYTINANTSFRDNQVLRGVSYCYEITAINANGESGPSNESCTQTRYLPVRAAARPRRFKSAS